MGLAGLPFYGTPELSTAIKEAKKQFEVVESNEYDYEDLLNLNAAIVKVNLASNAAIKEALRRNEFEK